ncbi:MAG: class I SAM-dependent methyltransferase family protein [Methanobrevibacter sp.]|nr:class I SAM-dependent methyltransferase family protein [Methanobrevibacter sp.]
MKWKKIGNILLVDDKFPYSDKNKEDQSKESNHSKKSDQSKELKELLVKHNVKTIAKIKNISGNLRQPEIELLAGNQTETIHKENGSLFKLDIAKVMWSKGNTTERMRIAKLIEGGEIVVDMFAGIGYFSIPIAIHGNPKKVFSIELNPDSYTYLKENITINKIPSQKIEAILGDCAVEAPKLSADRVIMGYVKTTHNFLKPAIQCLRKGGILHYHETVPEKIMNERPINRIKEIAIEEGRDEDIEILNNRIIKKYSPGVVHIVVDAKIY